jgi:hypothetical protein
MRVLQKGLINDAFKVEDRHFSGCSVGLPSWFVHTAVSKRVFGISEAVSKEINELVDNEDVHDLGRRMPQEPRLSEKFLEPEWAVERLSRLARVEMELRSILSRGPDYADAFYLHHALDLLAPRLIAVHITGLRARKDETIVGIV